MTKKDKEEKERLQKCAEAKAEEIAKEIQGLSFPGPEKTPSPSTVFDAEKLVCRAEEMGKQLGSDGVNLKTTQIRKFLDAVNAIKSKGPQEKDGDYRTHCILLKPRLAYAAGRQQEVKPLMTVLEPCIDKVEGKEDFEHFHRFVEAIVAYHRYHGGKDS